MDEYKNALHRFREMQEEQINELRARAQHKEENRSPLDEAEEIMCRLRGDTIVESWDGKWAIRIPKQ